MAKSKNARTEARMIALPPSREPTLEHLVANCRDLGGMQTASGRMTRSRWLLRSSSLVQISARTMDFLTERLGTCRYFDLRTDREVDRDGGAEALVARGWQWLRLPIQDEEDRPRLPFIRCIETLPLHVDAARRVVQEMSKVRSLHRPGIVACSLGKDRTGIVVALVLKWLGVSSADIAADFMLSNKSLSDQRHLLPPRWRNPRHRFRCVVPEQCLHAIKNVDQDLFPTESRLYWLQPFE